MKNYEYYLGDISRRVCFLNDFCSDRSVNVKQLAKKYGITLDESRSFVGDLVNFLVEQHKNEIEVVELRDVISVLNMSIFSPDESCDAMEEVLCLHRYIVNDTDPNFYVNKENAFSVIDDNYDKADAEHFKEIFDHLYVTRTIDVEDNML